MDINCIEKIISIIASIGTFGAALIAYWTLLVVKKQRNDALRPQILFKDLTTGFVDLSNFPNAIPFDWTGKDESLKNHVLFEMINSGQDIARNFKTEYKLDINSFMDLIKQNDRDNDIDIYLDNNWLTFGSNTNKNIKRIFLKVNAGYTDNLGYLLNRSIQEKPSGFAIPEEYLILNSCLLYLSLKHGFTIFTDQVPKIFMKTRYEDILGNKFYIYQSIDTFYFGDGEFHFSLKTIKKRIFYDA
jgi:hypothetical protein